MVKLFNKKKKKKKKSCVIVLCEAAFSERPRRSFSNSKVVDSIQTGCLLEYNNPGDGTGKNDMMNHLYGLTSCFSHI